MKEKAYLQKNNIRHIHGPNGEFKKQLPHVTCCGSFVFSKPYLEFTLNSSANEFVEHLLALIFNEVKYVTSEDRRWLLGMLVHLLESELNYYNYKVGKEISTTISNLSIRELSKYLTTWIRSFFQEEHNPLLATFALAASEFIGNHLFGAYYHQWEIEPWVSGDTEHLQTYFLDSRFKKEFTQTMQNMIVIIKMPDNVQLTTNFYFEDKAKIAQSFDFLVDRCYLSQNFHHHDTCELINPNEIPHDIFSDFKLPGYIIDPVSSGHVKERYPSTYIPAKWAIGIRTKGPGSEILYLPKWLSG